MSVILYFGMMGTVVLVGFAVIITTLLHWKKHGIPKSGPKNQ